MMTIPFVDAHHHLWDPQRMDYAWLAELPSLNLRHAIPEFQSAVGTLPLEQSVFVQCEVARDQSLDEVAWISDLAAREPRIGGIVAWAPVELPDSLPVLLEQLRKFPLVKGVRRLIQTEADDFCRERNFIRGVSLLADYDLSFDICIYHQQLPAVLELVRSCPHVRFVLDHCGKPDIEYRQLDPWRDRLRELSSLPNVWCKISGLVTEANQECWTLDDLRPYVAHVVECFGCERLMFGSDWPVVTLAASYTRWVEGLWELVADWPAANQTRLFRETARAFYRLR